MVAPSGSWSWEGGWDCPSPEPRTDPRRSSAGLQRHPEAHMLLPAELLNELINCAKCSVCSPGCFSRIPDLGSKKQKRGNQLFFIATNFTKRKKFFLFQQAQKNLRQFTKKEVIFTQKIFTKISDMGRGSGIRTKLIPDPDTGVKKASDRGSGSATLAMCTELTGGNLMTIFYSQSVRIRITDSLFWLSESKRNADLGTVTISQCSF